MANIKAAQNFLQELSTTISLTFSVTPSMENFDGGSKQTAASGTARTALCFSPHCNKFQCFEDRFVGSKRTNFRKVTNVTFQSSSVIAPTRMSRWIVSVGLRIAALGNKFKSAQSYCRGRLQRRVERFQHPHAILTQIPPLAWPCSCLGCSSRANPGTLSKQGSLQIMRFNLALLTLQS